MFGVSAMVARPDHAKVPEGMSAREYIAERNSEEFSKNHDRELAGFATMSELISQRASRGICSICGVSAPNASAIS